MEEDICKMYINKKPGDKKTYKTYKLFHTNKYMKKFSTVIIHHENANCTHNTPIRMAKMNKHTHKHYHVSLRMWDN